MFDDEKHEAIIARMEKMTVEELRELVKELLQEISDLQWAQLGEDL